jgi:hypothetical protein
MRTTQQFSITLPNEMAAIVKLKVETGEYAIEILAGPMSLSVWMISELPL